MGRPARAKWVISGLVLAGAVAVLLAWRSAIAPVGGTPHFAPALVARGAELAAIGDCAVCHTAPGGANYAGARAVPTPFGTVHATNITPDAETGIGRWNEAAFRRAMREGISRDGHHLYPVLPYPHFTRATDEDIGALYAFLMTRAPVRQPPLGNDLTFPLGLRPLLAGWNLLYLRPGPWSPDPAHDAQWNRGAYLVEAVAHCGACHTARNKLGAEQASQTLAGGEAEGWDAPALRLNAPSRRAWTADQLATYLRTGFEAGHGAAAGPMTAVTDALANVPEADVRAIAVYVASLMPHPAATAPEPPAGAIDPAAEAMFAGACGGCHGADAPMTRGGAPLLSRSAAVHAPTPRSAIQAILHGIPWREGRAGPYMPAFETALTDPQIARLAGYLRARYSGEAAWPDIAAEVAKAREGS